MRKCWILSVMLPLVLNKGKHNSDQVAGISFPFHVCLCI
jgi:hypothetical protein